MNDDHRAIPRHAEVHLQGIHTQLQGLPEGDQGVLGCDSGRPPMSVYFQELHAGSRVVSRYAYRLTPPSLAD